MAAGLIRVSISDLLSRQGVGVLGLAAPDEPVPYLLPLSFGFDGDSNLYFTYLHGSEPALENAWHPALLEDARYTTDVTIYRFRIEEQSGVRHGGLPADRTADDQRGE